MSKKKPEKKKAKAKPALSEETRIIRDDIYYIANKIENLDGVEGRILAGQKACFTDHRRRTTPYHEHLENRFNGVIRKIDETEMVIVRRLTENICQYIDTHSYAINDTMKSIQTDISAIKTNFMNIDALNPKEGIMLEAEDGTRMIFNRYAVHHPNTVEVSIAGQLFTLNKENLKVKECKILFQK